MTRQGRWGLIAGAALATAWVVAPAAIPLYDGPGFPDEPYRYVSPPAGAKTTAAPTTAQQTLQVRNGLSTAGFVNSGERGPQISIYVPPTGLQPAPGATTITVTATPLAPSAPLPTDGKIIGNVYKFAATSPSGPAKIVGTTNNSTPVIQMRAPSSQPLPVFEYLGPSGWTGMHSFKVDGKAVNTLRVGTDIFQTFAPKLGDYALVVLNKQPSSGGSGGGLNWALLGPGIGILAAVALIAPIRIARSRRAT